MSQTKKWSQALLDFEGAIAELEEEIAAIEQSDAQKGEDHSEVITLLRIKRDEKLSEVFSNLSPWQRVQLARHPKRPYTLDYARIIFDSFKELHGDRLFGDDQAIIGGIATLDEIPIAFIGQQKGRDIKENVMRNYGMARPEGYRKALRIAKLAGKFGRPLISLVDTPAADCKEQSEARGISEAIARNMTEMSLIPAPIVAIVIGEGGSGGAIGIAVADRVLMLEHSIYSVIPPEGCAAILWRDANRFVEATESLKITSGDALSLGIIDEIVPEPPGGAHKDVNAAAANLKEAISSHLEELKEIPIDILLRKRYQKFRNIGVFGTAE